MEGIGTTFTVRLGAPDRNTIPKQEEEKVVLMRTIAQPTMEIPSIDDFNSLRNIKNYFTERKKAIEVIKEENEQPPAAKEVRSPGICTCATKRAVVLVVDDNFLFRRLISDFVAEMGYQTIEASSGEEALEMLTRLRPGVVLMDIVMPGMTGMDAATRMRANPSLAKTPIIAVTSLTGGPSEADYLAAGFDAYMPKPIDLRRFSEVIRQVIA